MTEIHERVDHLEKALVDKGLIDPETVEAIPRHYEEDLGPQLGAKVVARAWVDPEYKARLLKEGTTAIDEFGFGGAQCDVLVAVENTQQVHNVIVCTLCSCYPWALLGLPPNWYKSPEYRSRVVREPRAVLQEFGVELPPDKEIRVWDSTAEMRYLVVPERPTGTDDLSEDQLAALITRDSMVGVGLVEPPA